jgi:hypothetical protein
MLPAVVAGVAIRLFFGFKLASLVELPLSVSWEVTVTEEVCLERDLGSDAAVAAVAFPQWAALVAASGEDWSLSAIAASAAFLFRVRRGVVKRGVRQRCRQWWGKGGFLKVGGDRGEGGSRPRDRGSLVNQLSHNVTSKIGRRSQRPRDPEGPDGRDFACCFGWGRGGRSDRTVHQEVKLLGSLTRRGM